ncbi:MAG: hypothetical protein QM640_14385 [Niabella sp.]
MSDELKDILFGAGGNTNNDQLLKYLNESLSAKEQHALEKEILNDEFGSDAMEGLEQIQSTKKIELIVDGLNRDLKNKTLKNAAARKKMQLKPQWSLYFSIIILLILLVLIYLFLRYKMQG